MTGHAVLAPDPAPMLTTDPNPVREADSLAQLSRIAEPGCGAALWRRPPPPGGFQAWIDRLDPDNLPWARVILHKDDVRAAVPEICDEADLPDSPERRMLTEDTVALAAFFAELMGVEHLRLRFDVIETNACRKFHIDAIRARLICTYRGTGTQYGVSEGGADPEVIGTVPTGSPILIRGTLWQDDMGTRSRLLHRSPPIEGTGETRLLLVLDPITDPKTQPDYCGGM